MLQVARLAPRLLSDAAGLVVEFLRSQIHETGGFKNRAGEPDLYYTVFGLDGLAALRADLPGAGTLAYLRSFGGGDALDFVHLACLARCWAGLKTGALDEATRQDILRRLDAHRSADGGYGAEPGADHGTVYGCFLAVGAYEDLEAPVPEPRGLIGCLRSLESRDGAYHNQPGAPVGSTPATAAAVTLLRHLDDTRPELADWLLARHHPDGGFFAAPDAPVPDLLSTATALHALAGLHAPLDRIRESCLDFVDSLWTSRGGFYGHWADETIDCEYTYYGLLALGHLSL